MPILQIAVLALLATAVCGTDQPRTTVKPAGEGSRALFGLGNNGGDKESVNGMVCPGVGKFAVKKQAKDNCRRYFECWETFKEPQGMHLCEVGQRFNRISRTCVPKKYANCGWCRTEGRYRDKTSNKHFIQCFPGNIGVRYKCKEGRYNPDKNGCSKGTAVPNVTDVTVDVRYDPPADIIQFMKDWKEAEKDELADTKRVDKSIEGEMKPYSDDEDDESSESEKSKFVAEEE